MAVATRVAFITVVAVTGMVSFFRPAVAETNAPYIGINLCPVNDADPLKLFADAVKNSRGFSTAASHTQFVSSDANGWPLADAGIVLMSNPGHTNGTYKLYFTTQNATVDARTVSVSFEWGNASASNQKYDAATNTVTYDVVVPDTNVLLRMKLTNTGGGVKNVKFMRPLTPGSTMAYDTSVTFTTPAKTLLSKFSTIRFMQVVNALWDNMVANWSDRTLSSYSAQQARPFGGTPSEPGAGYSAGVAWEYLVQLCNELDKDLFVNVPFLATDDYIRQLATLIKNTLKPQLKVYTEYSNECWNFSAGYDAGRNHDSAVAEVNRGGSPLNFDGETNEWYWGWRRTAKRGLEIGMIFRSVFGDSAMMTRVRPLLMNQLSNGQNTLGTGLAMVEGYYGSAAHVAGPHLPNYYFYGAGGAPYYEPTGTFDISSIWSSGDMDTAAFATNELAGDIMLCATFGLKRVAYEGGPQLPATAVGAAAWQDDRITRAMINHHTAWSNYGGDLFVYFTVDNWGSGDNRWSFIHYIEDQNTPKMRAVDSLTASQRAPITIGKTVPGSYPGASAEVNGGSTFTRSPGWRSYVIRVEHAGTYGVTVDVSNVQSGVLSVMSDDSTIGSATPSGTGTTAKYTVFLRPGLHGIMVRVTSGALSIDTVNVSIESLSRTVNEAAATERPAARPTIVQLSASKLIIKAGMPIGNQYDASLFDISGKRITMQTIGSNCASPLSFDISKLAHGTYFVQMKSGSVLETMKFVIEH